MKNSNLEKEVEVTWWDIVKEFAPLWGCYQCLKDISTGKLSFEKNFIRFNSTYIVHGTMIGLFMRYFLR
jgi:hypothetical protein